MSFVGTGGEDWVEIDGDLFDRTITATTLESVLRDDYEQVLDAIGVPFEIDRTAEGLLFIVVNGERRYRAELGRRGRLIFTSIMPTDGPL